LLEESGSVVELGGSWWSATPHSCRWWGSAKTLAQRPKVASHVVVARRSSPWTLDAERRALHATPNQRGYDSDDHAIEQVRLRCP
jgi:hypothetical protein